MGGGREGQQAQLALVSRAEEGWVTLGNLQAGMWHQGHTAGLGTGSTGPSKARLHPGQKFAVIDIAFG